MVLIISAIYCIVCGFLGAVNAERNKGEFRLMLWGSGISAFVGFFVSLLALTLFLQDEPAWVVWVLYYGGTMLAAAVAHFTGFFLCSVLHAAGNDVSA